MPIWLMFIILNKYLNTLIANFQLSLIIFNNADLANVYYSRLALIYNLQLFM